MRPLLPTYQQFWRFFCEPYSYLPAYRAYYPTPADNGKRDDGLCAVCHNLDPQSSRDEVGHLRLEAETTFNALKRSGERGCCFCSLIVDGITNQTSKAVERDRLVFLNGWVGDSVDVTLYWGPDYMWNVECTLLFYTPKGRRPPWRSLGTLSDVSSNSRSAECFELIRYWDRECLRSHDFCDNYGFDDELPKRVIRVGSGHVDDWPRLYESNGEKARYLALSHCWGRHQNLKTEQRTLKARAKGLDLNSLPKTFRDAIRVTQSLGISYLWIDSLCIIQDDKTDWEIESSKMSSIYANAYLTIAASSAECDQSGFLGPRRYATTPLWFNNRTPVHVRRDIHWDSKIDPFTNSKSNLHWRAWVYQERLLSRRVLYFEHDELVWECRTDTYCECGHFPEKASTPHTRAPSHKLHNFYMLTRPWSDLDLNNFHNHCRLTGDCSGKSVYEWWRKVAVGEYTMLELSVESDRLPALSGLAAVVQAKTDDVYLAGLWKGDLPRGLLWYQIRTIVLPKTYRAPSWCWPSVEGSICYDSTHRGDTKQEAPFLVRVLEAQCSPAGVDRLGAVRDGFITLSGPLVTMELKISALCEDQGNWEMEYSLKFLPLNHTELVDIKVCGPGRGALHFYPDVRLTAGNGVLVSGAAEPTIQRSHLLPAETSEAVEAPVWLLFLRRVPESCRPWDSGYFMVLGLSAKVPGAYERIGLLRWGSEKEDEDHWHPENTEMNKTLRKEFERYLRTEMKTREITIV